MGASDAAAHEGDVDTNQPTEVDMNTKVNTATAAGTAPAGTSTRPARTTLWQRAKHGWPARYPLVQFPNVPLLVAVAGLLVAGMAEGAVHDIARGTFFAGLAVWAWLELTAGVNWPHRVLGGAGLLYVVVQVAETL